MAALSPVESNTEMALKDWITRYLPGGPTAATSEIGSNLAVAALLLASLLASVLLLWRYWPLQARSA